LHDNQLTRTTNIAQLFPNRKDLASSEFTFEELLLLDAGSWFNKAYPDRAKIEFSDSAEIISVNTKAFYFNELGERINADFEEVFIGGKQQILALEDVVRIAEGYRIAKDAQGNRLYKKIKVGEEIAYRFFYVNDAEDSKNRPGVYIETKEPQLFPHVEKDLFIELDHLGWNQLTNPQQSQQTEKNGKVNIAETSARIILQTFSPESLNQLNMQFRNKVPVCFLLWLGDPNMMKDDKETYHKNLIFAKENGAHIIGPSIAGEPNNYSDLLKSDHFKWIKKEGFLIHPYSFDTDAQMHQYGNYSDGMFTNRADLTLDFYHKKNAK
jgi:glycerophosphoryl diester phosphodiesterase